jgi:hypothetical protein
MSGSYENEMLIHCYMLVPQFLLRAGDQFTEGQGTARFIDPSPLN